MIVCSLIFHSCMYRSKRIRLLEYIISREVIESGFVTVVTPAEGLEPAKISGVRACVTNDCVHRFSK
jgi:hypothetical protein